MSNQVLRKHNRMRFIRIRKSRNIEKIRTDLQCGLSDIIEIQLKEVG